MKKGKRLAFLASLLFWCGLGFLCDFDDLARASESLEVRVIESTADHMILQCSLNPEGLFANTQTKWSKILPISFAELLSIPDGVRFEHKILHAEYSAISHEGVLQDAVIAEKNPDALESIAALNPVGFVRAQKIGRLQVDPVVVENSSQEERFIRRLKLRIDFIKMIHPASEFETWDGRPDSESFEQVLKFSICNYEHARKYRVGASREKPSKAQPYVLPGSNAFKIATHEEGVYRISGKNLQRAGADLKKIRPATLRLFNLGEEVPVWVSAAKRGAFTAEGSITFYATMPPEEYRPYTSENIYWLTWGEGKGKRMEVKSGDLGKPKDVPFSFKVTYHGEEDREYMNPPSSPQMKDRWFWGRISAQKGSPGKRYFVAPDLMGIDRDREITLRLSLQGLTDDPKTDRDHHTVIMLNDHPIEDAVWSGREEHFFEGTFPAKYLVEGSNVIKVELPGDLDVFADQVLFNWLEIDWWTSVAQEGSLEFSHRCDGEPGITEFRCRDFKQRNIEVYDITDKRNVKRIVNAGIEPETTTDVIFQDLFTASGEEKSYLVIPDSRVPPPDRIEKVSARTDLRAPRNRADYIMITHENFLDQVNRLARYREKQGFKVKVVTIGDIYNQYSHGLFSPAAIRDFLKYGYRYWQKPAPSYLLLVGDANWDYKDNLHYGVKNLVPSYLVPAHKGEDAASDNWFACVSGDDTLPDMHVGRFPVGKSVEASNIVDKIIRYENSKGDERWKKRVLFVADDELIFEQQCNLLGATYLSAKGYEIVKLYLRSLNLPEEMPINEKIDRTNKEFSPQVIREINKGYAIIQYVGHGGLRVWSHKNILNSRANCDHWCHLKNKNRFPLVLAFSCQNGYFDSPAITSIAERFINSCATGAIAFGSNTRDSTAAENMIFATGIYDSAFRAQICRLGMIMTRSRIRLKASLLQTEYFIDTFTTFGDPAVPIGDGNFLP